MSRVLEFFREEAEGCLAGIRDVLAAADTPDADALYRHARRLRGSAQLARQDAVQELAAKLEASAKGLAEGEQAWGPGPAAASNGALDQLRALVALAEPVTDGNNDQGEGTKMQGDAHALFEKATRLTSELSTLSDDDAAEVRDELRQTLTSLSAATNDEVVGELVQHALSRLEASGASAVNGLLPNIRQAIGVKSAAVAPGADPAEPHATSGGGDAVVPIAELLFRGDRALDRALELRPVLEGRIGDDDAGREALDELFELIRLGRT